MKVVYMPSHLDGDGFYRLLFPGRELKRQHGWDTRAVPHVTESHGFRTTTHFGLFADEGNGQARMVKSPADWLLDEPFDVLVMQQRSEPWLAELILKLRAQGKVVIVDSDDAWFGLPSWNPGSRKSDGDRAAMVAQLEAADGLTVATPALAEMYREFQPNVRVIRNRLDWRMWDDVIPAYEVQRRRVRVGWMGESHWRRGDLLVLRGVIGPWLEAHPDVEFVAAGDPSVHDFLGVPPDQRVSTNRTQFWAMDLADITATFDIGLVPLDLGKDARGLNECKSHLKGLEYNACGIPFIASPSESYAWWVGVGGAGSLALSPQRWREALDAMLDDTYRHELGRKARAAAKAHTIQDGGVDEWRDFIQSCCSDRDIAVAELAAC